ELRVERTALSGSSAITAFMAALSSARKLRDLKVIRVEAHADQGVILSISQLSLPKLETLYLEELYFNFLNPLLLASITPRSYHLTLNPSEQLNLNLLVDSGTEEINMQDVHRLLVRFSINKLVLADPQQAWATGRGLHNLLCSIPTLKALIIDFYQLDNKLLKALEPPSDTRNTAFPKLEIIEFRDSTVPGSISSLKNLVTKHPIQRLVIGQETLPMGSDELVIKLKEKDGIVRRLKANVPGFQFIQHDHEPPEFSDIVWKL
ncbi:hypothetical protein FRC11_012850, partial [Ceratobasidium sp. 423]